VHGFAKATKVVLSFTREREQNIMKVAVVGATGLVGGVMLKVLEERKFPVDELLAVASERSAGKSVRFRGRDIAVIGIEAAIAAKPDLALFSAGASPRGMGTALLKWAHGDRQQQCPRTRR
jgi:hypothetical protein